MLLYNSESAEIFNLDNAVYISTECYDLENNLYRIILKDSNANKYQIVECESGEEAQKVLAKIYLNMTYGVGNMMPDMKEFREAVNDRFLNPNKNDFDYIDTDSLKTETGRTREEIREDGNEEK